MNVQY